MFHYETFTLTLVELILSQKLTTIVHAADSNDIPFTMCTFWDQWLRAGFWHKGSQITIKVFKSRKFQFWAFITSSFFVRSALLIIPDIEQTTYMITQTSGLLTLNPARPCWWTNFISSVFLENSMTMSVHKLDQDYTSIDYHYQHQPSKTILNSMLDFSAGMCLPLCG